MKIGSGGWGHRCTHQDNSNPEEAPSGGEFATIVQRTTGIFNGVYRECYREAPAKKAITQHQPFVPSSSFSFEFARIPSGWRKNMLLQSLASHEVQEA